MGDFVLAGYLIWVRGVGGKPEPQRAEELLPIGIGSNYWKDRIIKSVPLDAKDFAQPLDYLVMKYPFEGMLEPLAGK